MSTASDTGNLGISDADLDLAVDALFPPPAATPAAARVLEPPVILANVPAEAYHADLWSVGVGGLALMRRSPRHHWWECRRPGRVSEPPTDAQLFGTAVHCALLEPAHFSSRFAFRPRGDRRTKRGKAAYADFAAALGGRAALNHGAEGRVEEIVASVKSHPAAKALTEGAGKREVSAYWTDKETGVRCRMRPDFAPDGHAVLVDLKCTQDASGRAIGRTASNLNWPMRAAWYVDGWRAATGETREYVFACWESEAPYAFAAYFVEDDLLAYGRTQYRGMLREYAKCLAADSWPGYFEQVQPLVMPNWFKGEK